MSMTSASSEYFDRVAEEWDSLRRGYFTEAVRDSAIAKAYLRPEMVVADVGAGTGFMAAGLAPLVSQVHAVDGSAAMLDVARRNLDRFNNVVYHVADGQSLPFPDGSLDAVFANMYLHHCPDPPTAIREMVRVLRPGGRLVLTDMDVHNHEWVRQEMADEWLGFDRGQVRAWLRSADLVNVIVDCTGETCCAGPQSAACQDPADRMARVSVFVGTGTRRVIGAREAVQASYGAVATGSGSCCSDQAAEEQSCCPSAPEPEAQGQDPPGVPLEAATLSLGCGNPTAMASLRPGERVLDIGSGGGIDVFTAARKVGPTGRVIGLDVTPAMVERATRLARAAGLGYAEFRLGQAEAMPVEDGSMDVVLSNCVINLCEDKGKVFEEACRVLKEGGRLAISDIVSDGPLPLSMRADAQQWAGCVHGALPEREYLDLIAQAGFGDITSGRSEVWGEVEGVHVYSLSVSARRSGSGERAANAAKTASDSCGCGCQL